MNELHVAARHILLEHANGQGKNPLGLRSIGFWLIDGL